MAQAYCGGPQRSYLVDTFLMGDSELGEPVESAVIPLVLVLSAFESRAAPQSRQATRTAPVETSCGDVIRHRPRAPGIVSSTAAHHGDHPITRDTPDGACYQNRSADKSHREALRCLKRRLSGGVYRQLVANATPPMGAGPGGTCGRLYRPARPAHTPCTGTSDQSLTGPANRHQITHNPNP